MKSTMLWVLIGLNAVLVFMFISQAVRPNNAYGDARRPPDYLMIPGSVTGQTTDLIYIVDTTNGILGGMAYDEPSKKLLALPGPISLDKVLDPSAKN